MYKHKNTRIFWSKSEFKTKAKTRNMFPARPTGYFERVGGAFPLDRKKHTQFYIDLSLMIILKNWFTL